MTTGRQIQRINRNLEALLRKVDALPYVLKKLEDADIRYGLYAGSHVAALVNGRVPTDVDLLVHDDDLKRLKEVFPFARTKDAGDGVFLYTGPADIIEFMSAANVAKEGVIYPFRLTDLATQHLVTHIVGGSRIKLVNPVDTLILKAILQRGPEQGKHDLEDVEAVVTNIKLDKAYLRARLDETKASEITIDVWQRFGIPISQ